MHIKKLDDPKDTSLNAIGSFRAWCGAEVGGFTRSYLSVDKALMAIRHKVGAYPCHDCLRALFEEVIAVTPVAIEAAITVGQKLRGQT